jgi:hypothetical protein
LIVRAATLSLIILAVVAISACGDDDNGADSAATAGTVETSSLTKAQLVKQADEICAKGNEDLLERLDAYMVKNDSGSKSGGELAAEGVQEVVLPEVEAQIEEIESLGAPSGDEKQIEAFLAAQRRGVESLESRRSISLTSDLEPPFREAGNLARDYGFEACAYG